MILTFTAVLLACALGASLGRPIEKRDATATPCVDYTASYRQPNYILVESVKRVCTAVKDLENFINITGQQCPDNVEALRLLPYPEAFDEVVQELQNTYLSKISHAIKYGQNITECITAEDEKLRFNISTKLTLVQNTVQEMVSKVHALYSICAVKYICMSYTYACMYKIYTMHYIS